MTTRTQHSWGGGKGGGDDEKRDDDDDDDNDADQLHARVDSVVVSRGGERESLCSFVSSRDTLTKREACCVSQPSCLISFHLVLVLVF